MRVLITGGSGFIGTNLCKKLLDNNYSIVNLDKTSPMDLEQSKYWVKVDILNSIDVDNIVNSFQPHIVIHLAARTDVEGNSLEEYIENIEGTRNLIKSVKAYGKVEKIIITSTQFVHQNHGFPQRDDEYFPFTIYGHSKVLTETITRESNLNCEWIIVRPTNVWGPWHTRYPKEFWKIVSEGKYFHPNVKKVRRPYAYVGNVVWQYLRIIEFPTGNLRGLVLYVGDRPIDILEWVNGFSIKQIGRKVIIVPYFFLYCLAIFGEFLNYLHFKFPIKLSRLKSMTTSTDVPIEKTINLLGEAPYTLQEGIEITIEWLKKYYPKIVKV